MASLLLLAWTQQDADAQAPTELEVRNLIDTTVTIRGLNCEGLKGIFADIQFRMRLFGPAEFEFTYFSVPLSKTVLVILTAQGVDGLPPGPIINGSDGRSIVAHVEASGRVVIFATGRGGNGIPKRPTSQSGGGGGGGGSVDAFVDGDNNLVIALAGDGGKGGEGGDGVHESKHGKEGGAGGTGGGISLKVGINAQVCVISGNGGNAGDGGFPFIEEDGLSGGQGGDGGIGQEALGRLEIVADGLANQVEFPSVVRGGSGGTGGNGRTGFKGGNGGNGGTSASIELGREAAKISDVLLGSPGQGGFLGTGLLGSPNGKPGKLGKAGELKLKQDKE